MNLFIVRRRHSFSWIDINSETSEFKMLFIREQHYQVRSLYPGPDGNLKNERFF